MKLANGELRPGIILEVLDSKGTIKASAPGLFSEEDKDKLPPIYAWLSGASNTFSTPNVGDECWVLSFTDNPQELYWFRKDKFDKNNGSRNKSGSKGTKGDKNDKAGGNVQDQTNVEVLSSRESGTGWATIYFSDGTGWIIQNVDTIIQLDPDGKIKLTNSQPHGTVEISDNGIALGTAGGAEHPAPLGDKVEDLFEKIIETFNKIATAAQGSPYTTSIATAINGYVPTYQNDPQYINSDVVTLD